MSLYTSFGFASAGSIGPDVLAPPPPPPPPHVDFKDYLRELGDQVVAVPDGTVFTGTNATGTAANATHAATGGAKGGFVVIRAATPGTVVVDGTTPGLGGVLDLADSSRVCFDGIWFKNEALSFLSTSHNIVFWYCDFQRPDFADWDPVTSTIPRFVDQLSGSNHAFYGCDFHAATATVISTNTDTGCVMRGCRIYDAFERVSDPNGRIHMDSLTTITGPSTDFEFGNGYIEKGGRFIWEAGNVRQSTLTSAMSGLTLPRSTITVADTHGFSSTSNKLKVTTSTGLQTVSYTSRDNNAVPGSFFGCTGGTGTMATGGLVYQDNGGGNTSGVNMHDLWYVDGLTSGGQWQVSPGYKLGWKADGTSDPCLFGPNAYVWKTAGGTFNVNVEAVDGSFITAGSNPSRCQVTYSYTGAPPTGLSGITDYDAIRNHASNPAMVWRAAHPRSSRDSFFGWS